MMALFVRDLRLSVRAGGGALVGILFYLAVVAVIPFGIGPDLKLLAKIGTAFIWIGALLAGLLGLERMFQSDREDGGLDLMVMAAGGILPLAMLVLVKSLAHWVANILPLVLAAPLLGLILNMEPAAIGASALTLLVGSPAISLIGAVGASVGVVLPRGGLLVTILVLPLLIPVLIFGVLSANAAVSTIDDFTPPFLILSALTMFFAVLGPLASAAALSGSEI